MGHVAVSGDIFDSHNWGGSEGKRWLLARDAAKHPTTRRQLSRTKNYLAHNISSAEIEKPCPKCCSEDPCPSYNLLCSISAALTFQGSNSGCGLLRRLSPGVHPITVLRPGAPSDSVDLETSWAESWKGLGILQLIGCGVSDSGLTLRDFLSPQVWCLHSVKLASCQIDCHFSCFLLHIRFSQPKTTEICKVCVRNGLLLRHLK